MFYCIHNTEKGCRAKGSLFFLLVGLAWLQACQTPTPKKGFTLAQTWISDSFVTKSGEAELGLNQYRILRLYPNGKFSAFDNGRYNFGDWKASSNGMVYIEPKQGSLETQPSYFLLKKNANSRRLVAELYRDAKLQPEQQEGTYYFSALELLQTTDPWSPAANQWRIPPAVPENDQQIKERTLAYLQYLRTLLTYAYDNNLEFLSTEWQPKTIHLGFSNGLRMAYNDELEDWYSCFYDSSSAIKAYQLISGAFPGVKMRRGEGKWERDKAAIEELIEIISKQ